MHLTNIYEPTSRFTYTSLLLIHTDNADSLFYHIAYLTALGHAGESVE